MLVVCAMVVGCWMGCEKASTDPSQMQDFMKLYSGLVEKCFNACAQDFTSKALTTNEVDTHLSLSSSLYHSMYPSLAGSLYRYPSTSSEFVSLPLSIRTWLQK